MADRDVALAVDALPAHYRAPYLRLAIERRSYNQIARDLDIPLATVGTRVLRARRLMRQFLERRLTGSPTAPKRTRSAAG